MAKNCLKVGDTVVVIAGKDKGSVGVIQSLSRRRNGLVATVDGVNIQKVHQKANPQMNREAKIVEKFGAIATDNLAIYNSATQAKDKIQVKVIDGNRVRTYRSTGEQIGEKA